MSGRTRIAAIALVVVVAALGVGGLTVAKLYSEAYDEQRRQLVEIARSRARLIEAVARFDAEQSADYPGGAAEATLAQIREAHARFPGFGETGEYVLARRVGDEIVFLLPGGRDPTFDIPPVHLGSSLADPMALALAGLSGSIVAPDYSGRTVLAAYEPVDVLTLGLVAKMDVAEVRAPYVRAGVWIVVGGGVVILVGIVGVLTLGGGLVGRIETLEKGERRMLERIALVRRIGRVGTLEVDVPAGRIHMDPELSRLLGEEAVEAVLTPSGFLQRVHPDDRREMLRRLGESRSGQSDGLDQAFRIRTADGRFLSVVAAVRAVEWDEGGTPVRLLGTVADVTAIEEARDHLFAREAHLRAAQEMGRIGSFEWSRQDGTMWWSDELFRLLGAAPGEIEPSAETFLERVHPDERDDIRAKLDPSLEQGLADEAEFRIVLPSGVRWMRGAARPHVDMRGRPGRMIGFLQDITETHEMGDMLRQAQKMETLGLLSGGIAHDFNNLLTAIRANVDLLNDRLTRPEGGRPAELHEGLDEIRTASTLGAEMVRKLMAFSRVDLDDVRPVDVGAAIEDTRTLLLRLLPESMVVDLRVEHGALLCRLDRVSLQEILLNLATNARDAMEGRGTLSIESSRGVENGEQRVIIRVCDDGGGMARETAERAFEPFFTTKGQGRGTGLGLAMVRVLVEKQGGRVGVHSEVGVGTTFTLSFPGMVAAAVEAAPETPRVRSASRGNERILVVEDDPAIRRVAEAILRRFGYQVVAVADAEEGLERLRDAPTDLVVSDVMLPRMSGIDLYERTRALARPPRFLMMSGYGAAELNQAGGVGPGLHFLRKPWGVDELLAAVRAALDEHAAERRA